MLNDVKTSADTSKSVLLIEDNLGDANLVKTYLEGIRSTGYSLDHASCLKDGIEMAENKKYDAILTDLGLPDSSGLDAISRMMTIAPESPLVVITGSEDDALAMAAMREGAQEYLIKGKISSEALNRVLRYAMERFRWTQEATYLAYHDALTGLPNRTLFLNNLEYTLAHARRNNQMAAVYFMDLDGFKDVNDSYGHDMGDKLLQAVACRLKSIVRSSDTISRFGGDEFALLQTNIKTQANIKSLAGKITRAFEKPFQLDEYSLLVGITFGIAVFPDHSTNVKHLIKKADLSLYEGKKQGKQTYIICH